MKKLNKKHKSINEKMNKCLLRTAKNKPNIFNGKCLGYVMDDEVIPSCKQCIALSK